MRSILRATLIGGSAALATFGATLGLAGMASAEVVRVTIAEYSAKTGPYFAEVEQAFEAEHPETDIQFEVVASTPQQFAEYIRWETPRWAKVIRDTGAKAGN